MRPYCTMITKVPCHKYRFLFPTRLGLKITFVWRSISLGMFFERFDDRPEYPSVQINFSSPWFSWVENKHRQQYLCMLNPSRIFFPSFSFVQKYQGKTWAWTFWKINSLVPSNFPLRIKKNWHKKNRSNFAKPQFLKLQSAKWPQ